MAITHSFSSYILDFLYICRGKPCQLYIINKLGTYYWLVWYILLNIGNYSDFISFFSKCSIKSTKSPQNLVYQLITFFNLHAITWQKIKNTKNCQFSKKSTKIHKKYFFLRFAFDTTVCVGGHHSGGASENEAGMSSNSSYILHHLKNDMNVMSHNTKCPWYVLYKESILSLILKTSCCLRKHDWLWPGDLIQIQEFHSMKQEQWVQTPVQVTRSSQT